MKKIKGNIAETAVIHYLAKLGLPVFKEIGDSVGVDVITIVNKKPITIQVKYGELNNNNSVSLSLRKTGPNGYVYYYQQDDFNLFALYVANTEQIIWINTREALANKNSVQFRTENAKNNQQLRTKKITDYLDFYKAVITILV